MSTRQLKEWSFAAGFLFLMGCVSPPIQTGFLSSYQGMAHQYDLDGVRVSDAAHFSSYDTLAISAVDTKLAGHNVTPEDLKHLASALEANVRKEMSKYFKNMISAGEIPASSKAIRLDLSLTEVKPTDVAMNLIVGFGAGNATASIEGRFIDLADGRELAAFMDRKKGSPFTKKEFDAGAKFPNWSQLRYLYLFTEIWAENISNIVKSNR